LKEALVRPRVLQVIVVCSGLLAGCEKTGDVPVSVVQVGDRKVVVAAGEWRAMPNETAYSENFEAITNTPPRQYQVVTFFLNP
jgi:hypothetical protein